MIALELQDFLQQQELKKKKTLEYILFCKVFRTPGFRKLFFYAVAIWEQDHLWHREAEGARSRHTAQGVCTEASTPAGARLNGPARRSSSYLVVRLLQGSQDVQYRLRLGFQVIIHQGVYEHRTTV